MKGNLIVISMSTADSRDKVWKWLKQEGLAPRDQPDQKSTFHFLVRYPPGPHGHMFAVVQPKKRDLLAVTSFTRVDEGQQNEMLEHITEDLHSWHEWMHDIRLSLTRSGVDWAVHVGGDKRKGNGPLQAFNVSEPTWLDGLTKNSMMQSLRKLWLAKLTLIHEIKHNYGPGIGKPGPVQDIEQKTQKVEKSSQIETDESGTFGADFDPSEWV